MNSADLLIDAFGRIRDEAHNVLAGLTADELNLRLDGDANTIGWLVWHQARVQDDHIAGAFGVNQVWTTDGWVHRFGLPFDELAIGYGHSSDEVGAVQVSAALLIGYHDAVHAQTVKLLQTVTDVDLERVVDTSWDPPVVLGVRLISVISDGLQHIGQAAFIRGIALRSR
jgi:hypothetical protein